MLTIVTILPAESLTGRATSCPTRTEPFSDGQEPATYQKGLAFFASEKTVPATMKGRSFIRIVS